MLEAGIEKFFKDTLEAKGFKVLKLVTPGTAGAMDRMILRPRYWPGPPMVCEMKKPKAAPRALQQRTAEDWQARGVHVLPYIDSIERAREVCNWLFEQSREAYEMRKASLI